MQQLYLGRNISEDKHGYFLTFSNEDLTSSHDKKYARNHHHTYAKAKAQMDFSLDHGATWINATFDPTI